MSGIKNLKEKSKIQLDEMFETKPVGKPEFRKNESEENKPTTHTENPPFPEEPMAASNQQAIQSSGKMGGFLEVKPEISLTRLAPTFPIKQPQKGATYKMTFNLTEDVYKAFNDLYAYRMLQGRKTEKSEMICEAIQWLIKMEEERTH